MKNCREKPCIICNGTFKPNSGRQKRCVICKPNYKLNWQRNNRLMNRDRINKNQKELRIKNPKRYKLYAHKSWEKNKHKRNKPKLNENVRRWRLNHLEQDKEIDRLYRLKNKQLIKIRKFNKYSEMASINELTPNQFKRALQGWSILVKNRDDNMCIYCGSTNNLHAHHELPKKDYPELALVLNNGITICKEGHLQAHNGSWNN
jgi:hypothetical protein